MLPRTIPVVVADSSIPPGTNKYLHASSASDHNRPYLDPLSAEQLSIPHAVVEPADIQRQPQPPVILLKQSKHC